MKILNLQEFVNDQTNLFRERRTSQYTRFLDKSVNFVTYYSVNRTISTESINNREVDSYIGEDSPVRYNKINNLPVYGFPIIDSNNTYSDEGGFTNEFSGSIVMLPNIVEPVEGDCFVLNIFSQFQFFRITEVEQVAMRAKPHYVCQFIVGIPDQLKQLNSQVVEEYNAIFDNIGTQDRVVISSNEYNLRKEYEKIYNDILDYYMDAYYKPKLSMFEISAPMQIREDNINYTDKFLIHFMKENRVIIFDTVTRNLFTLDYNHLDDADDYLDYKKTIYWAIENRDMSKFLVAKHIMCKKISSPFTLVKGQCRDEFFKSEKLTDAEPNPYDNQFYIDYDFEPLWKKWNTKDVYSTPDDCYDKVLSIIVSYLRGDSMMMPGYFQNIIGEMTPIQEFMFLPIILYIIRNNIHGLMNTQITL